MGGGGGDAFIERERRGGYILVGGMFMYKSQVFTANFHCGTVNLVLVLLFSVCENDFELLYFVNDNCELHCQNVICVYYVSKN